MFKHFKFFLSYLGHRISLFFGLTFMVSLLDSIGLGVLIQALVLLGGTESAGDDPVSKAMERYSNSLGLSDEPYLILVLLVVIFLAKGVFLFGQSYYQVHLQYVFTSKIRSSLIHLLSDFRYAAFAQQDAGKLQNQLTAESQRLIGGFMAFFRMVTQYIMLSVYMGFALLINPFFVLFCGVGVSITNLIYRYFNRRTFKSSQGYTEASHRYQSSLLQLVHNFYYLKGTDSLGAHRDSLKKLIQDIEVQQKSIGWFASLTTSLREPFVITIIALALGFFVLYLGDSISAITVVILLMYRAMNYLQAAEAAKQKYYGIAGSIETIINLQNTLRQDQEDPGEGIVLDSIDEITFEGVKFSYDGEGAFSYDFDVRRGETIAIVGASGSGKSTLLSLLLGLFEPDEGTIKINGQALADYQLGSYRKQVGLVDQRTVVFNDTVFNNVSCWAPAKPQNLEHFWRVMDQVDLKKVFEERKDGANTILGDNGMKISGGQRQRISIARELYKDFGLLIMDEATASLDAISANLVRKGLMNKNKDAIRFLVSHKLNSTRHATKILLLDKGRIVAQGSFNELVAGSPLFNRMLSDQPFDSNPEETVREL